jgi:hypothetical protein
LGRAAFGGALDDWYLRQDGRVQSDRKNGCCCEQQGILPHQTTSIYPLVYRVRRMPRFHTNGMDDAAPIEAFLCPERPMDSHLNIVTTPVM